MINLTIDGLLTEVPADTTVLQAARKLRINIPTLCYYDAIEAYGGCRLCLVEAEKNGRSRLTASCTLPVEEGLIVQTQSPRAIKARLMTMELLLARCPEVPALQRMGRQLGVTEARYSPGNSDCILCGLCVRVCSELQHVGAIGMVGRGVNRQVMTPFGEASEVCRTCGACATEGIFLAGLCHNPKPLEDSIRLGLAAAARASTILSRDYLELNSNIATPIDANCDGCAFCVDGCPFKAITLLEYMKEGQVKKTVEIEETVCKGCGSCMATCPKQGIIVAGFSIAQLEAQVDAALGLM